MTARTLSLARLGVNDAFRALTDPYRRELHVHCYRMLGSVQEAEDMLQETLLAAWHGLEHYEERDSLRAPLAVPHRDQPLPERAPRGRRRRRQSPGLPYRLLPPPLLAT